MRRLQYSMTVGQVERQNYHPRQETAEPSIRASLRETQLRARGLTKSRTPKLDVPFPWAEEMRRDTTTPPSCYDPTPAQEYTSRAQPSRDAPRGMLQKKSAH